MRLALKIAICSKCIGLGPPPLSFFYGAALTGILKGIRNISMCDQGPQITSPQHFRDIVAALAHYHNVTAAA